MLTKVNTYTHAYAVHSDNVQLCTDCRALLTLFIIYKLKVCVMLTREKYGRR